MSSAKSIPPEEVEFCRRVLKGCGMTLTIHDSMDTMPETMSIDEVLVEHRVVHLLQDRDFRASLWHEVGHAVTSDDACRGGKNWYPEPTWVVQEDSKDTEQIQEEAAVAATATLLAVAGVPFKEAQDILDFVCFWNGPQPRQHFPWFNEVVRALDLSPFIWSVLPYTAIQLYDDLAVAREMPIVAYAKR